MTNSRRRLLTLLTPVAAFLAACGGGGGASDAGSGSPGTAVPAASAEVSATPASLTALGLASVELAQTHVLPPQGKQWTLGNASESLHFVGQRAAFALIQMTQADAIDPALEGHLNGRSLGTVPLSLPSALPATEGGGPAYAADRYSATVPSGWMQPGLRLRLVARNYAPSDFKDVQVGADMTVTLKVLPMYLYGADDALQPFAKVKAPDSATVSEMFAKWPVAQLEVQTHPAQRLDWPYLVIGPSGKQPAYVAHNTDEEVQDSPRASVGPALGILSGLRSANGEGSLNVQYYGAMILRDAAGVYKSSNGGRGSVGGDTGVGDITYAGIFIHEQGHAMGLPHAGEAYDVGQYPYRWGSLEGSAWGFDASHNEFLAPFMPVTSAGYANCASATFATHPRTLDTSGRCVKQDPMQSGSGDQDPHYKFATFSDFSTGVMQRHFEGLATAGSGGSNTYQGGYIVEDAAFASGYKRWDRTSLNWVEFTPTTTSNAQGGYLQGFPIQKGVPVYAIALTISKAGTAGATQIYPAISYTGNLLKQVDPTDAVQRAEIDPTAKGAAKWYCVNSGCDYTLRVTYANGTVRHVLLQGGFRTFNAPGGAFSTSVTDPVHSASFKRWVVNVPNDALLSKIELLDTSTAWTGWNTNAAVLASR